MPISLDPGRSGNGRSKSAGECIHIGLVNNMPDGALQATERQFKTLLGSAAGAGTVRLSLYALPDLPRTAAGLRHVEHAYSSTENLRGSCLDALIVTGADPRSANLTDEPYWESLTRVLNWAEHNTYSAVWSCLAAHAAVLHLDGISRRRRPDKLFGIFECAAVSNHGLTAGVPAHFKVPHSRWNDIPEDELTACGYSVLTRSVDAGADMFVKKRESLFVFFQGHPEYESDTLLLEYRTEVGRYLRGETGRHPSIPRSYFDSDAAAALTELRQECVSGRHEEPLLAQVSTTAGKRRIANTWGSTATCIYRNWLEYIRAQKRRSNRSKTSTNAQMEEPVLPRY
jgi:homoserine O-succinyltransferase